MLSDLDHTVLDVVVVAAKKLFRYRLEEQLCQADNGCEERTSNWAVYSVLFWKFRPAENLLP